MKYARIANIKKSIRRKLKKNKVCAIGWFLFLFPLGVGWVYSLPLPQYVAVDSGDLLGYYGVAFGIFSSFLTYLDEKRKAELEKQKERMPRFYVELEQRKSQRELFDIRLVHLKTQFLVDVHLFDEFAYKCSKSDESSTISFCLSKEKENALKPDHNITMDWDIMDADGYPKYIQIVCYDIADNGWVCEFDKVNNNGKITYVPVAPRIV